MDRKLAHKLQLCGESEGMQSAIHDTRTLSMGCTLSASGLIKSNYLYSTFPA